MFPFDQLEILIKLLGGLEKDQLNGMGVKAESHIEDWFYERLVKSFKG